MSERPYPDGVAWDEALRQRTRADKWEKKWFERMANNEDSIDEVGAGVAPIGSDPVCRGCYALGSACGRCRRCTTELVTLLMELIDDEPCHYDHHGLCQTHSLHERPCPHETGKHVLTTARHRHGIVDHGQST